MTTGAGQQPRHDRPLRGGWAPRVAWSLAGLAGFCWIAAEDVGTGAVMTLAVVLAAALGLTFLPRHARNGPRALGVGLLTGVAVPVLAVVLMFTKVSLHAHPYPDFTVEDVIAVVSRVPIWAISGLLAGAAAWLLTPDAGS